MTDITHLSEYATKENNTAGELTSILEIDPEDGTVTQIKNRVRKGSEAGVPVFMDLQDSGGNPLPNDTEVIFRVDVPSQDQPIVVSERIRNIASWNALSMTEQRNEENIDATKIELKGSVINVRHFDTLRVDVVSSAVVDWANSELYVDSKATRSVPHQEG